MEYSPPPLRSDPDGEVLTSRIPKIAQAIKVWQSQLLDMTARNTLLYYKDHNRATIDLRLAQPQELDRLLSRQPVALSSLLTSAAPDNLMTRGSTIRKKAAENYEERGVQTLLFTWGVATWQTHTPSRSAPRAPVLLFPAELRATGPREKDLILHLSSDWMVNETLLQHLHSTYGVGVDAATRALPGVEGDVDTRTEVSAILASFERLLQGTVPGLSVSSDERHLSNFSYTKMAMVEDLDALKELLLGNDIVAGIAGDTAAQQAINAHVGDEPPPPDLIPPADEFLTLDADSSQSRAINAALGGRSLIIEGPPGTGKSQTIANLIGASVARGRRVLFVAEKRAAIDAVMDRLHGVDLGDIVLDLHGGTMTRKKQMEALQHLHDSHAASRVVGQEYADDFVAARAVATLAAGALRTPSGLRRCRRVWQYRRTAHSPCWRGHPLEGRHRHARVMPHRRRLGRRGRNHSASWIIAVAEMHTALGTGD